MRKVWIYEPQIHYPGHKSATALFEKPKPPNDDKYIEFCETIIKEIDSMNESYTLSVYCTNCDFSGNRSFLKGNTVSQATCAKCGCATLQLQPKATWKTETREIKLNLDKKLDKLNKLFDDLGKGFDDLFK